MYISYDNIGFPKQETLVHKKVQTKKQKPDKMDAQGIEVNAINILLAPSAPVITSVTSPTFSTISLTWTAPLKPNGRIRNYQITYHPTANISDVTTIKTETLQMFIINGLTAFTKYSISVSAITTVVGNASDAVIVTSEDSK